VMNGKQLLIDGASTSIVLPVACFVDCLLVLPALARGFWRLPSQELLLNPACNSDMICCNSLGWQTATTDGSDAAVAGVCRRFVAASLLACTPKATQLCVPLALHCWQSFWLIRNDLASGTPRPSTSTVHAHGMPLWCSAYGMPAIAMPVVAAWPSDKSFQCPSAQPVVSRACQALTWHMCAQATSAAIAAGTVFG
jgi:hypothetical protein